MIDKLHCAVRLVFCDHQLWQKALKNNNIISFQDTIVFKKCLRYVIIYVILRGKEVAVFILLEVI